MTDFITDVIVLYLILDVNGFRVTLLCWKLVKRTTYQYIINIYSTLLRYENPSPLTNFLDLMTLRIVAIWGESVVTDRISYNNNIVESKISTCSRAYKLASGRYSTAINSTDLFNLLLVCIADDGDATNEPFRNIVKFCTAAREKKMYRNFCFNINTLQIIR